MNTQAQQQWDLSEQDLGKIKATMHKMAHVICASHPETLPESVLERMWNALPDALCSYSAGRGTTLTSWILTEMRWAGKPSKHRWQREVSLDHAPFQPSREVPPETRIYVQELFRALFPAQQELVALLYQGYTVTEAAAILGIKPNTSVVRLYSIRQRLRAHRFATKAQQEMV